MEPKPRITRLRPFVEDLKELLNQGLVGEHRAAEGQMIAF